jgi:hypothetical protein
MELLFPYFNDAAQRYHISAYTIEPRDAAFKDTTK